MADTLDEKEIQARIDAEVATQLEAKEADLYAKAHAKEVELRVNVLLESQKIEPGQKDALIENALLMPRGKALDAFLANYESRTPIKTKTETTKGGDKVPDTKPDTRQSDVIIDDKIATLSRERNISLIEAGLIVEAENVELFEADAKRTAGNAPAQKEA